MLVAKGIKKHSIDNEKHVFIDLLSSFISTNDFDDIGSSTKISPLLENFRYLKL